MFFREVGASGAVVSEVELDGEEILPPGSPLLPANDSVGINNKNPSDDNRNAEL